MSHRAAAVASRAIELSLRGEPFRLDDVRRGVDDAPSQSTIHRVLRQLEADEWIEQRGNAWHPDVKATMLGDAGDTGSGGFEIDTDDLLS
jgi:hypothetical protein